MQIAYWRVHIHDIYCPIPIQKTVLEGERREGVFIIAANTKTLPMTVREISKALSRVTINLSIVLTNFLSNRKNGFRNLSFFLSFFLSFLRSIVYELDVLQNQGGENQKLIKQRIGIYFLYQYIKCFMSFYPLGSRWIQTQDKCQVTAGRIWLFRIIMCMLAGNKQGQPLQDLSFVTNSCKCSYPRSSAKSINQSINQWINQSINQPTNQ